MTLRTELAKSTRNALMLTLLATAINGLAAEPKTSVSDAKTAEQELFKDRPLELSSKVSYMWTGDVAMKPLEAGTLASISVNVINRSGDDWEITGADASCGCTKAGVRNRRWPSGQTNMVELQIKVPSHQRSTEFRTSVSLKAKSYAETPFDLQITLRVHCVIEGMVSFPNKLIPVDISGEQDIYRIPVVCSSQQNNLEAECSRPDLVSDAQLVLKDDRKMIEFVLAKDLVSESGDHCQITVSDLRSGMSDTATLMLERPAKVSVSPRTLRFSRDENDNFKTSAIVRFASKPGAHENKDKKASKALIEAQLNGVRRLQLKQQVLAPNIIRVEIRLSNEAISEEAPEGGHFIKWNLMNEDTKTSARSPLAISKR